MISPAKEKQKLLSEQFKLTDGKLLICITEIEIEQ
jgi:hypothetical protein